MMAMQSREGYIAQEMERWRCYAQCQCGAHAMEAMRRAADHWDFMKKLDEWKDTPEGRQFQRDLGTMMGGITQERKGSA